MSAGIGLPKVKRVTLRYSGVFSLSMPDDGLIRDRWFRANSIWDPNATDTLGTENGSVYGYSQWANLYTYYKVVGSKITVKWMHNGQIAAPATVAVVGDDDMNVSVYTGSAGGMQALREKTGGAGMAILPRNTNRQVITRSYYSGKKRFAISDNDDALPKVLMGNNGSAVHYFGLLWDYADGAVHVPGADEKLLAQVDIEYLTELIEPLQLTPP